MYTIQPSNISVFPLYADDKLYCTAFALAGSSYLVSVPGELSAAEIERTINAAVELSAYHPPFEALAYAVAQMNVEVLHHDH